MRLFRFRVAACTLALNQTDFGRVSVLSQYRCIQGLPSFPTCLRTSNGALHCSSIVCTLSHQPLASTTSRHLSALLQLVLAPEQRSYARPAFVNVLPCVTVCDPTACIHHSSEPQRSQHCSTGMPAGSPRTAPQNGRNMAPFFFLFWRVSALPVVPVLATAGALCVNANCRVSPKLLRKVLSRAQQLAGSS